MDSESATVEQKLEVVTISVSDVDRAKRFYASLGWREDADFTTTDGFRGVQFTPPGSEASVHFGVKVTSAEPGTAEGLFLTVSDIEAARDDLVRRGVEVGDFVHRTADGIAPGLDPDRGTYRSLVEFSDPDGNAWRLQEVNVRPPGRVSGARFADAAELGDALRRAAEAHGEYEARNGGEYDENWPEWYARYLVAEQTGAELPA